MELPLEDMESLVIFAAHVRLVWDRNQDVGQEKNGRLDFRGQFAYQPGFFLLVFPRQKVSLAARYQSQGALRLRAEFENTSNYGDRHESS